MHFLNFSENMSQILAKISKNCIFHNNWKSGDLHTKVFIDVYSNRNKDNIGFTMLLMTVFELFSPQCEKK